MADVDPCNGFERRDGSVYTIRKSRGINWTHEEKVYLVQLCAQRASIIEEKRSDMTTLSRKAAAWKLIYDKFSIRYGRKRTPLRIKEQWKRMKIAARAEERVRLANVTPQNAAAISTAERYYNGESLELLEKVRAVMGKRPQFEEDDCPSMQKIMYAIASSTNDIHDAIQQAEFQDDANLYENNSSIEQDEPIRIKIEMESGSEDSPSNDDLSERSIGQEEFMNTLSATPSITNPVTNHSPGIMDSNSVTPTSFYEKVSESSRSTNHISANDSSKQNEDLRHSIEEHRAFASPESKLGNYNHTDKPQMHMSGKYPNTERQSNVPCGISPVSAHDNSSSREIVVRFAKIEHNKKMEYLAKEHAMKMEILQLEKEKAVAKLRKAEHKLASRSQMYDPY